MRKIIILFCDIPKKKIDFILIWLEINWKLI